MAALVTTAEVLEVWPGFSAYQAGAQAALVARASAAAESYCDRAFSRAEATEVLDGPGAPLLWLRRLPVVSVSSVSIDGQAVDTSAGRGWSFDPATGLLVRGDGRRAPDSGRAWPAGVGNISVTYTGGPDGAPDDVKHAVVLLVKHMAEAPRASTVKESERIGDYSVAYRKGASPGIPPEIAGWLDPHRHIDVALG